MTLGLIAEKPVAASPTSAIASLSDRASAVSEIKHIQLMLAPLLPETSSRWGGDNEGRGRPIGRHGGARDWVGRRQAQWKVAIARRNTIAWRNTIEQKQFDLISFTWHWLWQYQRFWIKPITWKLLSTWKDFVPSLQGYLGCEINWVCGIILTLFCKHIVGSFFWQVRQYFEQYFAKF